MAVCGSSSIVALVLMLARILCLSTFSPSFSFLRKFEALCHLMSEEFNYREYRRVLDETLESGIPCIPFLGVLLTTIVQCSAHKYGLGSRKYSGVEDYTVMEAVTVRNRYTEEIVCVCVCARAHTHMPLCNNLSLGSGVEDTTYAHYCLVCHFEAKNSGVDVFLSSQVYVCVFHDCLNPFDRNNCSMLLVCWLILCSFQLF